MKKTIKIANSRLFPPADFCELWRDRSVNGVKLDYNEYEFIMTDGGRVVLFDAYTASRRYAALDMECGVLAFPFAFTCMTDEGERVAYCGLRFSENEITDWRAVVFGGAEGLMKLSRDPDAMAVQIPSGVCVISSVPAYEEYETHIKDDTHPLAGNIILNGQTHAVVSLFDRKYAVFSTGWGDGGYKCYKGTDSDGKLVAFIVDFGMVEPKEDHEIKGETETEIDVPDGVFFDDASKSGPENNVERWTYALEHTTEPELMLQAYSRRGYAYHSMNMLDHALADYEAAINCCVHVRDRHALSRAWSVFDNAAELLVSNGDHDAAIEIMRVALSLGDDFYGGAYVRLVDLYLATKRYTLAFETAKKMLESRPDDPVACMKYAESCVALNDYEGAADAYETLASGFRLYENLFDEAACLIEIGEYERADAALERHPAKEYNEQYWYYKAYIAYKDRKYTRAVELAIKAHDIDGAYLPALYLIIDIKTLMHDFRAVARFAEEYKKLRPKGEYGFGVCAEAHFIDGNYSESAKNYYYLYTGIVGYDRYAALAAISAERSGDGKHAKEMLRALKKNRSPYYPNAYYALYASKYHDNTPELTRALFGRKTDAEFSGLLASHFASLGMKTQARKIMRELSVGDVTQDTVAAQIRVSLFSGDFETAKRYFAYYIDTFVGKTDPSEVRKISDGFAATCKLDGAATARAIMPSGDA